MRIALAENQPDGDAAPPRREARPHCTAAEAGAELVHHEASARVAHAFDEVDPLEILFVERRQRPLSGREGRRVLSQRPLGAELGACTIQQKTLAPRAEM
jgi:hypothetical protein